MMSQDDHVLMNGASITQGCNLMLWSKTISHTQCIVPVQPQQQADP